MAAAALHHHMLESLEHVILSWCQTCTTGERRGQIIISSMTIV